MVSARREEGDPKKAGGNSSAREFRRTYQIPRYSIPRYSIAGCPLTRLQCQSSHQVLI